MSPGFQGPYYGYTLDGENWITVSPPLVYVTKSGRVLRCRVGGGTDGPSIPLILGSLKSRYGPHYRPGVLHDHGFRNMLEEQQGDGTWSPVQLEEDELDDLFLEAMELCGVSKVEAELMFEAVKRFGHASFEEDRKAQPAPPPEVGI